MPRTLDQETLNAAALHYAAHWLLPSVRSRKPSGLWIAGRDYVTQDLFNLTFKDEFAAVVAGMKEALGGRKLAQFEAQLKAFPVRDDGLFRDLLAKKLAIDPDGAHIEGAIGSTQIGVRLMGPRPFEIETAESIRRRKRRGLPLHAAHGSPGRDDRETLQVLRRDCWPIYAGEGEERAAGRIRAEIGVGPGADPLPPDALPLPVGAEVTNISAEAALAALDAIVDKLDEGSTAATIRGRTGAQPADPDAAESGTLLFTLTCSDPAFGAAADIAPGARATAAAITDDSSADATGTLGYCRAGATGTGVDDHIDGNAGTSDAAFVFNTLAIVAGGTVSMSSWTVTLPQGSTAS